MKNMNIEQRVKQMYQYIPYPYYGDNPLDDKYLKYKEFMDLILGFDGEGFNIWKDKTILEGGCGTGRESFYIASKGGSLYAIDINEKSLEVAKSNSRKFNFRYPIKFQQASVLDLPYPDNNFDIVLSSGVIHHTHDPEKAFNELVRVLKPNGYLVLFVYNNWAHIIPNFRRFLVHILSSDDIHNQAYYAKKLFPKYLKNRSLEDVYDEFSHPHKSEHSIKQVLSWFKKNNVEYKAVWPRFGWKGDYLTKHARNAYFDNGAKPSIPDKYNNPSFINRIYSASRLLYKGLRAYSHGYRYLGKKKELK